MSDVHHLSRQDARRLAVRAQLLDRPRPDDLLETVSHLVALKVDPTSAIAPSAELVGWSRLGPAYASEELRALLEDRLLVELQGMIRPADDIALFRAEMAAWPGVGELKPWQHQIRDWVVANDACRRDILARMDADGPVRQGELPDTCAVPWGSSGWNNDRNVERLLVQMSARGEVAVAGREGRERLWDRAERVYPDDPVVPLEEAERRRDERRLASLGIARARKPATARDEPDGVGAAGEPAVVEGLRGEWRIDATLLEEPFEGRTALLSPLDRLVYDRARMTELLDFDYQLEMYKPASKRRWGYYALPVLHGDRLVGKLDAKADRKAGLLRVHAVHEDEPFTADVAEAVDAEIEALAVWLELEVDRGR